ncbi:MAG: DUF4893 domain-containing protein [Sphingomicrobium sp.]
MRILLLAATAVTLTACAANPAIRPVTATSSDWRTVVTENDRERLRNWRGTLLRGIALARAAGHGAEIDAEGALFQPDAALGGGPIPNGQYRCRVIKLGAKSESGLDYVAYPAFTCRVQQEKNLQGFAKLTGSQRPIGLIFPGEATRQVLLGTLVLGDEARAMQYGRDPDRDVAAWVERIGPARWRMIFPSPHFESLTDVMELVPAG